MNGCDEYEIAIEMRLHGALDPDGSVRLDEHLPTCSGCRAFRDQALATEEAMKTSGSDALHTVDWTRIEAGFEAWKRSVRRAPRLAVLMVGIVAPILALAYGRTDVALAGGLLGGLAVIFLGWRMNRRLLGEAAAVEHAREDLLAFHRAQLDRRIKVGRQDAWVLPLIAVLEVAYLLATGRTAPLNLLGMGLLAALFVGLALRKWLVELPRLVRERRALD